MESGQPAQGWGVDLRWQCIITAGTKTGAGYVVKMLYMVKHYKLLQAETLHYKLLQAETLHYKLLQAETLQTAVHACVCARMCTYTCASVCIT